MWSIAGAGKDVNCWHKCNNFPICLPSNPLRSPSHLKTLHVHILHMIELQPAQLTYTEKLVYDTQIKIKTDYCQDTVYRAAC